jgi:hypothetical protein
MYIIPMEAPPSITVPTIASPISPVWSTCSNIVVTLPAKLSGTSHDQLPTIPDYETIMHPISTEKVEFLKNNSKLQQSSVADLLRHLPRLRSKQSKKLDKLENFNFSLIFSLSSWIRSSIREVQIDHKKFVQIM